MFGDHRLVMFAVLCVLAALALGVAGGRPSTEVTMPSCELTISLDKKVYHPGEPVWLTAVTRSGSPQGTEMVMPGSQLRFAVTCGGAEVAATRYAVKAAEVDSRYCGSFFGMGLQNGQSHTERALLSRWVDLTLAGKYEVVVSRQVDKSEAAPLGQTVRSNTATFEIQDQ